MRRKLSVNYLYSKRNKEMITKVNATKPIAASSNKTTTTRNKQLQLQQ